MSGLLLELRGAPKRAIRALRIATLPIRYPFAFQPSPVAAPQVPTANGVPPLFEWEQERKVQDALQASAPKVTDLAAVLDASEKHISSVEVALVLPGVYGS